MPIKQDREYRTLAAPLSAQAAAKRGRAMERRGMTKPVRTPEAGMAAPKQKKPNSFPRL